MRRGATCEGEEGEEGEEGGKDGCAFAGQGKDKEPEKRGCPWGFIVIDRVSSLPLKEYIKYIIIFDLPLMMVKGT